MRRSLCHRAFTLVEMMVVIAILVILFALLLPSGQKAREQAYKLQCMSNERMLVAAAIMYSNDNKDGIFFPGFLYNELNDGRRDNDSLAQLYPKYFSNLMVATCPATENRVYWPRQLRNNASGPSAMPLNPNDQNEGGATGGFTSYEVRTRIDKTYTFPDGFKAKINQRIRWIDAGDANLDSYQIKTRYEVVDASRDVILTDAKEGPNNNWPDKRSNHGPGGMNCAFADGHVEFLHTGRELLAGYLGGHYIVGLSELEPQFPKLGLSKTADPNNPGHWILRWTN